MNLFYDGAIVTNTVTVLVMVTIALSWFTNRQLSIALFVSLFSIKYFTHIDAVWMHVLVLPICAFISIVRFDKIGFVDNKDNYAIGFIYILREPVAISFMLGLISLEPYWVLNILLLTLQLIIIWIGIYGSANSIFDIRSNWRGGGYGMDLVRDDLRGDNH